MRHNGFPAVPDTSTHLATILRPRGFLGKGGRRQGQSPAGRPPPSSACFARRRSEGANAIPARSRFVNALGYSSAAIDEVAHDSGIQK
ncbi:MAG: hypothetical protein ABSE84_31775, partial [Isosphaeraceae bacterium]